MWSTGTPGEEQSPRLIETVLRPNKRKNNSTYGNRARPEPNPLGMNQDDSDPDIETPRDDGC